MDPAGLRWGVSSLYLPGPDRAGWGQPWEQGHGQLARGERPSPGPHKSRERGHLARSGPTALVSQVPITALVQDGTGPAFLPMLGPCLSPGWPHVRHLLLWARRECLWLLQGEEEEAGVVGRCHGQAWRASLSKVSICMRLCPGCLPRCMALTVCPDAATITRVGITGRGEGRDMQTGQCRRGARRDLGSSRMGLPVPVVGRGRRKWSAGVRCSQAHLRESHFSAPSRRVIGRQARPPQRDAALIAPQAVGRVEMLVHAQAWQPGPGTALAPCLPQPSLCPAAPLRFTPPGLGSGAPATDICTRAHLPEMHGLAQLRGTCCTYTHSRQT